MKPISGGGEIGFLRWGNVFPVVRLQKGDFRNFVYKQFDVEIGSFPTGWTLETLVALDESVLLQSVENIAHGTRRQVALFGQFRDAQVPQVGRKLLLTHHLAVNNSAARTVEVAD